MDSVKHYKVYVLEDSLAEPMSMDAVPYFSLKIPCDSWKTPNLASKKASYRTPFRPVRYRCHNQRMKSGYHEHDFPVIPKKIVEKRPKLSRSERYQLKR